MSIHDVLAHDDFRKFTSNSCLLLAIKNSDCRIEFTRLKYWTILGLHLEYLHRYVKNLAYKSNAFINRKISLFS